MKTINVLVTLLLVAVIGMASVNAGETTQQDVNVTVGGTTGLEVSPSSYNYGDLCRGECSETNPDDPITLNSTGTAALDITTHTTGIFVNIEYWNGTVWIGANDFSTEVNGGTQKNISTRICIPSDAAQTAHTGNVTFEYMAL